jgi:hypothetical protein
MEISPQSLETWGRLSPKSTFTWMRKLAVLLAVLLAPWFLAPWRYALLYVLLALFIQNETEEVIPIIVALVKQELSRTPE